MNHHTANRATAIIAGLILLSSVATAFAQSGPASSDIDLLRSRVKAGDTIIVTDAMSRQSIGKLTTMSDSTIALKLRDAESNIPMVSVREIAIKGDSVRNGALTGAAIGAGLTITVGAAWCSSGYACSRPVVDTMAVSVFTAALLGGIGALIDKAHTGRTVIYRAGRTQTSLQPILADHRRGVSFTVRR